MFDITPLCLICLASNQAYKEWVKYRPVTPGRWREHWPMPASLMMSYRPAPPLAPHSPSNISSQALAISQRSSEVSQTDKSKCISTNSYIVSNSIINIYFVPNKIKLINRCDGKCIIIKRFQN